MEEAAKNTDGVKDAVVNFMTLKMSVEFEEGAEPSDVMKKRLLRIVRRLKTTARYFYRS